jgi:hypothetical protein
MKKAQAASPPLEPQRDVKLPFGARAYSMSLRTFYQLQRSVKSFVTLMSPGFGLTFSALSGIASGIGAILG